MSRGWPEGSVGARQVKATSGHGGAEGPGRTDAPWRPALGADVHGNLEPRLGSAPAPGCHDRGAATVQTVGAAGRRLPELSALSPPFVWGSKIIPRRKGYWRKRPPGHLAGLAAASWEQVVTPAPAVSRVTRRPARGPSKAPAPHRRDQKPTSANGHPLTCPEALGRVRPVRGGRRERPNF